MAEEGPGGQRFRGFIDRIDRSEDGRASILDYKRSATAADNAFKKGRDGIDLQLPLYEHLRDRALFDGPARVAYGLLPAKTADVTFALADWSDDVMATALAAAAPPGMPGTQGTPTISVGVTHVPLADQRSMTSLYAFATGIVCSMPV